MRKILVIDDDPILTTLYKKHFEAAGFIVEIANDAVHGFVRLQVFQPDLIVLDLNMPLRGGLDFLADVRDQARYKSLPVLVVTGEPEDSPDVQEAKASEATGVLFKKQWNPEALVTAVNWLLTQAHQPRPGPRKGGAAR